MLKAVAAFTCKNPK